MKKQLQLVLLLFILFTTIQLQAQQAYQYNAFGAKLLFVDFGVANGIEDLDITNGLEIQYQRGLAKYLSFAIPLKVGVANVSGERDNVTFFGADALLHLRLARDSSWFHPYLLAGGGILASNNDESNVNVPLGIGADIRVGKNAFINLQGEYRVAFEDERSNIQVGIGLMYHFGKQDRDGDGIADAKDKCPDVPGTASTSGCPDTDGDGISDARDKCPTTPGSARTKGCPDSDGDGITDDQDACPTVAGKLNGCPDEDNDGVADKDDKCPSDAGLAELEGCPDTDGDGVADPLDKCINEAGPSSNGGCPVTDRDEDGVRDEADKCPDTPGTAATLGCPDSDGDGVADADDRCPEKAGPFAGCPDTDGDGVIDADDACVDQPGPTTNKGCPEIKEEEQEVLDLAMSAVQFETGSATLKSDSYTILDQIVEIANRYAGYSLSIEGHTDNVGDAENNQVLSEDRARACYQYLLSKGIQASRLSFQGFGESQPIANNNTRTGRRRNRRVEFNLFVK
ncbi:MAG: OmpA family protein [Bacteroidota bacterium]